MFRAVRRLRTQWTIMLVCGAALIWPSAGWRVALGALVVALPIAWWVAARQARAMFYATPSPYVLLRTGWSARWPDRKRYFGDDAPGSAANLHFPSFGAEAAKLLVEERRAGLLGLDTASIDHGPSKEFPVHRLVAAANVPGLENLTALDRLPATGAWLVALPMKIAGGSGGPLRACRSPVDAWLSAPITCSTPASGSTSPSSVASTTYAQSIATAFEVARSTSSTPRTRSPSCIRAVISMR